MKNHELLTRKKNMFKSLLVIKKEQLKCIRKEITFWNTKKKCIFMKNMLKSQRDICSKSIERIKTKIQSLE